MNDRTVFLAYDQWMECWREMCDTLGYVPAWDEYPEYFDCISCDTSDGYEQKHSSVVNTYFAHEILDLLERKELLDEMTVFVYNEAGNMVAQGGFHDDCIFGAAIGYQGFKVMSNKFKLTLLKDHF